jgi:four helix bundle protein
MKRHSCPEAIMFIKFSKLAKQLNMYLNHFPKAEKYALADRIRNTAYDVYDLMIEGQKRYQKKSTLTNLDIAHERLRMQLHLAYELGYFRYRDGRQMEEEAQQTESRRYLLISEMVDELGRLIGGWIGKVKEEGRW